MVGRKGGLSGKQKSALLKAKRVQVAERNNGGGGPVSHSIPRPDPIGPNEPTYTQQVSKGGKVNELSTRFVREDDEVVAARKLRGSEPLDDQPKASLVYAGADSSLGLPTRPAVQSDNAATQEANERVAFEEWLTSVHGRFSLDALSPFEHNLEVWRQLWRCLERADVVCIVADIRNPLLHVPAALYAHCAARRPALKIVIVLSKVDLVTVDHVDRWKAELGRRFPLASLALFSSKGRPVGGSTGGGVASRRKQINGPLRAAELRQVRAYVEGVAEACGVALPDSELDAEVEVRSGAEWFRKGSKEARAHKAVVSAEDEWGEEEESEQESEEAAVASRPQAATPKTANGGGGEEAREEEESEDDDDDEEAMMRRMVASSGAAAKKAAPAAKPPPPPASAGRPLGGADVGGSGSDEGSSCSADDELEGLLDELYAADGTVHGAEAAAVAVTDSAVLAVESVETGRYVPAANAAPRRAGVVTLGFVGHPNVGKTSLLNAIVGRKVASVSRTPGHTKHLQTWELSPRVTICDSPGLVFPVAGALVLGRDVSPRAIYECCGLFPIAQIREPFSAVRLLAHSLDLVHMYNLHPQADAMAEEEGGHLSPLGFCLALAERKGYAIARGKGSLDPHRAGLEVLKDCVDGAVCLAFAPPEPVVAVQ